MSGLLHNDEKVLEFNHSHPFKRERLIRLLLTELGVQGVKEFIPSPSGFNPESKQFGKGDKASAESVLKHSPETQLNVYDAMIKKYIPYNSKGIKK